MKVSENTAVTIGMPVFNDVDFIEESISSILNQTFKDFHLIISDDQSTDGSGEICRRFADERPNITYIRQHENIGISKNMEFLLDQANSKYFIWAADDDLWHSSFLESLVNALRKSPDAVVSFSTFMHINERGEAISESLDYDYSGKSAKERLRKIIVNPFDAFGYGLFIREAIKEVKFPIWSGPNKHISYNNIYPTLCYYLSLGNYVHVKGKPLFFNRVKTKPNHSKDKSESHVLNFFLLVLRKIELSMVSLYRISEANQTLLAIRFSPLMLKKWTIVPIYYEFLHLLKHKL